MNNLEHESEDAWDYSEELRDVARPTPVENEGLLITQRGKVDSMEIGDFVQQL